MSDSEEVGERAGREGRGGEHRLAVVVVTDAIVVDRTAGARTHCGHLRDEDLTTPQTSVCEARGNELAKRRVCSQVCMRASACVCSHKLGRRAADCA